MNIRPMLPDDWPAVAAIYEEGMHSGIATFEQELPSWDYWNEHHLQVLRFVATDEQDKVIGWVAVSPISSRPSYRGVIELSLYIASRAARQGVGSTLLQHLIEQSEQQGFWTLISGIFSENQASRKLHEKMGFRLLGFREKVGQLNGQWRDVCLYERRSQLVGK